MAIEIKVIGRTNEEVRESLSYLADQFGLLHTTTAAPASIDDIDLDTLVAAAKGRLAKAGFIMSVREAAKAEAPAAEEPAQTEAGETETPKAEEPAKPKRTRASRATSKTAEAPQAPEPEKAQESPDEIKARCIAELQKRYALPGGETLVSSILADYGNGEVKLTRIPADSFVEIAARLWPN